MTDETQLSTDIARGEAAKAVLENEAFLHAFESIEAEITSQWKSAPARDVDGRERLWALLMMLRKVKTCLETTIQSGNLAKAELIQKRSLYERAKDFVAW